MAFITPALMLGLDLGSCGYRALARVIGKKVTGSKTQALYEWALAHINRTIVF